MIQAIRGRRLPLSMKIMLPFLILVLTMGVVGTFVTVRYVTLQAQARVDEDLFTRSVSADAYMRDRVTYLFDAARTAANIEGAAEAVEASDEGRAGKLLASVPAVRRTELDLLVATDRAGTGLVHFVRNVNSFDLTDGGLWSEEPLVDQVLRQVTGAAGENHVGFLTAPSGTYLAVSVPIRTNDVVGAAVAGVSVRKLAAALAARLDVGVGIYGTSGDLLSGGSTGRAPRRAVNLPGTSTLRQRGATGRADDASLFSPVVMRGIRVGSLAVTTSSSSALGTARGAARRLSLIVLIAMVAIAAVGAWTSKRILRQVQPLLEANRALGRGDYTARVPIVSGDELAELAEGLNMMADEIQAAYREQEMRVEARTEELQRLYDELVRSSEAQQMVFTGISHEFRTPLFVILGYADLMADAGFHPRGKTWRGDYGTAIKDSANSLLEMVNEILAVSAIKAGKVDLAIEQVPIESVLQELRKNVEPLARRSELKVNIDIAKRLPMVMADPKRLQQMLLNLCSNSIKYTPAGGRISVAARESDGAVEFIVSDSGVGITPELGDAIFTPFYRVKGTTPQMGQPSTGLGLSLVKGLVEAHDGTVHYTSEPGKGSTFTLRIPASSRPAGHPNGGRRKGPRSLKTTAKAVD